MVSPASHDTHVSCAELETSLCRYRAKVEKMEGGKCHVLYMDFGNVSCDVSATLLLLYCCVYL